MENSKWQGFAETKVMAPLEAVWKITSDYYGEHKWFPGMKSCEKVEGAPEQGVGAVRLCKTSLQLDQESSDYFMLEELIAFDGTNLSFTVRMTDTNIPGFIGYEGGFEFSEAKEEGSCLMKWSFQMNPIAGRSKEDVEALRSSILTGMVKNLEQLASSQ